MKWMIDLRSIYMGSLKMVYKIPTLNKVKFKIRSTFKYYLFLKKLISIDLSFCAKQNGNPTPLEGNFLIQSSP